MKSNITSFIRISGAVRSFIILGLVFIGLVVFLFLIFLPESRCVCCLKVQFETNRKMLDIESNKLLTFSEIEKKILDLRQRYSLLKEKLPDDEHVPLIVKQLSEELGKFDIKLLALIPEVKEISGKELLGEMTVEIIMQSDYQTLGRFIEAISNLPLLFILKDISIERGEVRNLLTTRLVFATYSYED